MSQTSVVVGEGVGDGDSVGVGEGVALGVAEGVGVGVRVAEGDGGAGGGAGGRAAAGGRGVGAGAGGGAGGGCGAGEGGGGGGGAGGAPIRKETDVVVEPFELVLVAATLCDPGPAPDGTVKAVKTLPPASAWHDEGETTTAPSKVTEHEPVTPLRLTETRVPADPELGLMLSPSAIAGEARRVTKDATSRVIRKVGRSLPPACTRCVLIIRKPRTRSVVSGRILASGPKARGK